MAESVHLCIDQDRESACEWMEHARYRFRYAFARAPETRIAGDSSQDYLELAWDETGLAFALCDGVSESFFGGFAARLLGRSLINWLLNPSHALTDPQQVSMRLAAVLASLVDEAKSLVQDVRLPDDMSPLIGMVLEQKRAIGSESMFTAGRLDLARERVTLAWLGDPRVRIWCADIEQSLSPGSERERWSSSRGPLGQPHVFTAPLGTHSRIVTYSDGCAVLDTRTTWDDFESIADAASHASSDDASLLEIRLD
jgi:hypothetical protein